METIFNIITPIVMFASSILGLGGQNTLSTQDTISEETPSSVEIGLYETSPRGEEGGFAMPASGCSAADPLWHGYPIHDCSILPDISTNKPIIRLGDPVTIFWDPKIHGGCLLSSNVEALSPTPDAGIADSRVDYPTGETSYSIVCDGVGNSDSVTVKVLPRIQET